MRSSKCCQSLQYTFSLQHKVYGDGQYFTHYEMFDCDTSTATSSSNHCLKP
jgi:hypothetical protein